MKELLEAIAKALVDYRFRFPHNSRDRKGNKQRIALFAGREHEVIAAVNPSSQNRVNQVRRRRAGRKPKEFTNV
jgi:hypothetical protein